MNGFWQLVRREIQLAWTSGNLWLPVIFFLSVAMLFPFVTGPDKPLLARTGGGILWIAALLSSLLPIERLVLPDKQSGFLDQLAVRGWSDELVASAKIMGHISAFGIPMVIAAVAGSALVGVPEAKLLTLLIGLAIALPALSGLGVTIAALTAGLNGASALGGLLLVPMAIPILIFGSGTLSDFSSNAMQLLCATSLAFVALSPFAAGAALRALRE